MRTRVLILAVVLAAGLAACSDDSDKGSGATESPSAPLTELTVECAKFADTAKKITDAQTALYSGKGASEAIDTLVAELDALKEDAPEKVKTALSDMSDAFRSAEEILAKPTQENQAALAELAPKLAADGQTISAYILDECG